MSTAPPVILLAAPYSHASRLGAMLGQHPEIYAPLELNLLLASNLGDLFKTLQAADMQGLLRSIAQLYAGEQTLESIDMARRWVMHRVTRDAREVHRELCARVVPRRLLDTCILYSDPGYEQSLERLRQTYPQADYLHLVRHPLAQGLDWLRDPMALAQLHRLGSLDPDTPRPLPDPQFDWERRQRVIREFLRRIPPERQYRLRSEDLFDDPRATCARLCAWLGLAWSEKAFEAMLHPERSSYACPGPYGAEGGSDSEFLADPRHISRPLETLSLEQPLPWRSDGHRFKTEVLDLARVLGYE